MYIPLNSGEAGQGQRFASAYPDIQDLREAWVRGVDERKWTLAAQYQMDLDKRRDQMVLHAIEQSTAAVLRTVVICSVAVFVLLGCLIRFR